MTPVCRFLNWFSGKIHNACLNLAEGDVRVCLFDLPVEFVEVWEISGLLSLLEVDWVLGWTWIAWSCWGTPVPGDTQRAKSNYGKSSNTSPGPRRAAAVLWGWEGCSSEDSRW